MYGYIISLTLALLFSVALLHKSNIDMGVLVKSIAFLYVVGVVWDIIATTSGWWSFSDGGSLIGVRLILPVEEYVFMFVIPLMCVSVYGAIRRGKFI